MTERFIVDDDGIVTDMLDLSMCIDNEDCCEKLNELNDEVVKGDLFKLTVAMAIQHRINWLKKQLWDNTDRIDELQSLKKELKL